MLGRLAKRLRLAGWDTLYERYIADAQLVSRARDEGRLILTRDRRLLLRRGAREGAFLLHANAVDDQWREMLARWPGLVVGPIFSRCAECNTPIEAADRDAVRELVPPYVYRTHENFYRCPGCGRIYWPGTHLPKIRALLGRPAPTSREG